VSRADWESPDLFGRGILLPREMFPPVSVTDRERPRKEELSTTAGENSQNTLEGMQRKSQVSCSAFSRHYACQRLFALISCFHFIMKELLPK